MHILSDDYVFVKSKEQWNKFDPEHEYFVRLDAVLTWFWSKSVASVSNYSPFLSPILLLTFSLPLSHLSPSPPFFSLTLI